MTTRELDSELFGRAVSFRYSEHWVAYAILGMRLVIGWTFFYAGITKVANPDWSVRGFLLYGIPEGNPFTSVWATMANDWAYILTPLNQVGLTLIGLGLMAGAFMRLSAVFGSLMMGFYWAAHFPHDNALIVSQHIVYILLLFGLGAFGAGRILGLDARLEKLSIVKRYPDLRLLLG
ncbi:MULTISPECIES: DoxX family protein [Salinibaculum]|uniref:DoxX family protein n=1 Tax=Salinibaculum TaxID=2732368 RepID=UPI0030CB8149